MSANLEFPRWFALRTRPRHEKSVAQLLKQQNIECFVPLYRVRSRWADRIQQVELPLFPGYVFGSVPVGSVGSVIGVSGVRYIVGYGRTPAEVDPIEIDSLRRMTEAHVSAEPWASLIEGQRVRITCGPLAGVEGTLAQVRKRDQVALAVRLLQRCVLIDIDRDCVEAVDPLESFYSQYSPAGLSNRCTPISR